MKTIQLNKGAVTIVDDDDFQSYGHLKWHLHNTEGYAIRRPIRKGRKLIVYLHRLIARATDADIVHHINGDKLDNRRQNLELTTKSRHTITHGQVRGPLAGAYRGVSLHGGPGRKPWRAQIMVQRHAIFLGVYSTAEEAAMAWDHAARFFFGPSVYQNFPDDPG